jgi:tRNA A-37 threonylcarbamoyl transferase component Bud32
MPERCELCEQYQKNQKDLRERRSKLWRRGELTDAIAQELSSKEQRIIAELKEHQATQHGRSTRL